MKSKYMTPSIRVEQVRIQPLMDLSAQNIVADGQLGNGNNTLWDDEDEENGSENFSIWNNEED